MLFSYRTSHDLAALHSEERAITSRNLPKNRHFDKLGIIVKESEHVT